MPVIYILSTGGTIAATCSESGEYRHAPSRAPRDWRAFAAARYPGERICDVNDAHADTPFPAQDSCEFGPAHWRALMRTVGRLQSGNAKAVIILHGTDTMTYSACALSFLGMTGGAPIIFTGAQRPASEEASDAHSNIDLAMRAAVGFYGDLSGECVIAFGGRIIRGVVASKTSSDAPAAFSSRRLPPIEQHMTPAAARSALREWRRRVPQRLISAEAAFADDVACVPLSPGFQVEAFAQRLGHKPPHGVVFSLYGVGAAPDALRLADLAERLSAAGVLCLAVSACVDGEINWNRYKSTQSLLRSQIVDGGAMSVEAAIVKTMWVAAQPIAFQEKQIMLARNVAGERQA